MTTTLNDLRGLDLYLGTPYSKYPAGLEQAFVDACNLCGKLLQRGLIVYSPIAHTHPVAMHAGLDPLDHKIWLPFDEVRMNKADAMLVAMMKGWETSKGIQHEIDYFMQARKDVYFLDVKTMELAPTILKIRFKESNLGDSINA
jgi:Domain of unknown function (DUF1937)